MIPFIKNFIFAFENLDDLQPDETEVKGIVPSPRYNLRARAVYGIPTFRELLIQYTNLHFMTSKHRLVRYSYFNCFFFCSRMAVIKAGHGNGVKSNSGDSADFFPVGPHRSLESRLTWRRHEVQFR
ncbi:hypothetical protein TNCV_5043121 [Trichonephila clavipes]|nr:hypothetical protein TNCV_5043121 [Trichonephila clavipes]